MHHNAGENHTTWERVEAPLAFTPLQADATADVCIVGAGMSGLCCAYELITRGRTVIVLDDGEVGGGQTARTSGHLSNAIDARYHEIARVHGERGAQLVADSHTRAIARIEEIARAESIECAFERLDGHLVSVAEDAETELERELEAARAAGLDVDLVRKPQLGGYVPEIALRFPSQAQFHPQAFVAGLARAIAQRGGQFHTGTHVTEVHGGSNGRVETRDGPKVRASAFVVATNAPINDRVVIHTKQAAYTTYVIACRSNGPVHPFLMWDDGHPYHYVRRQRDAQGELLLIGGEDHRTGQADDANTRFRALEQWAQERFPGLGPVVFRWSGQVFESVDGLAFLGRNPMGPNNVYVLTGDSGQGLTHASIGGMLIADLIDGRESPWKDVYEPARKPLLELARYARENARTVAQYADWLKPAPRIEPAEVAPGSGALVQRGLEKLALYRDPQGKLHEMSAICPHLGGLVRWNASERTWDCPCHGSRFDAYGAVIVGPANRGLAERESAERKQHT